MDMEDGENDQACLAEHCYEELVALRRQQPVNLAYRLSAFYELDGALEHEDLQGKHRELVERSVLDVLMRLRPLLLVSQRATTEGERHHTGTGNDVQDDTIEVQAL